MSSDADRYMLLGIRARLIAMLQQGGDCSVSSDEYISRWETVAEELIDNIRGYLDQGEVYDEEDSASAS